MLPTNIDPITNIPRDGRGPLCGSPIGISAGTVQLALRAEHSQARDL
jgi:hypothetical protein